MTNPFDPPVSLRNSWLASVTAFVTRELDTRASASASGLAPTEAADVFVRWPRTIPEQGVELDEVLAQLADLAKLGLQTNGPGYLAYVPGGGLFSAALASFVALVLNRFVGLASASPGLARLEHDVVELLCRECGYGPSAAGILVSGGSLANLSAVATARTNRLGETGDYRHAIIYTSSQAHRSIVKGARLAGIPGANVRLVAVDAALRMDVASLKEAIARDRAAGLTPFMVVGAGGTTNSGAIDPLHAIADLCTHESLWLHVDAAYGGAFVLTDEGKHKLAGIARADSITLDPHKGFFLPYGVGCLLVRDGAALRAAHADRGAYLQDLADEAQLGVRSAADYGPELSRSDRGILLWLPFMVHGVATFRAALSDKLVQARRLARALAADPRVVIAAPTELSIVAFRMRREGSLEDWNRANLAWLARINARQRVYLSSTLMPVDGGEVTTLRACVLAFRTDAERVDEAIADILESLDEGATDPSPSALDHRRP